jgi:hypothetical protein
VKHKTIVMAFLALIALLNALLLGSLWPRHASAESKNEPAVTPPFATSPPPLKVGGIYSFGYITTGQRHVVKVTEVPQGNWVKIECQDEGRTITAWMNLLHVGDIVPDPPAPPPEAIPTKEEAEAIRKFWMNDSVLR